MTPTLAMIVNREMEIKNFTPVPYYELEGIMKYGEDTFPAFLLNPEPIKSLPTPYAFDDRKKLEAISNSLGNKGIVVEVKKEEVVNKAPKLYNLSELQSIGTVLLLLWILPSPFTKRNIFLTLEPRVNVLPKLRQGK